MANIDHVDTVDDLEVAGQKVNTDIEKVLVELGCTGKRIKPQDIVKRITGVEFKTVELAGNRFMFCAIKMKRFVVVGAPSVCISPENFSEQVGKEISFENTFNEIYKLEAYRTVES